MRNAHKRRILPLALTLGLGDRRVAQSGNFTLGRPCIDLFFLLQKGDWRGKTTIPRWSDIHRNLSGNEDWPKPDKKSPRNEIPIRYIIVRSKFAPQETCRHPTTNNDQISLPARPSWPTQSENRYTYSCSTGSSHDGTAERLSSFLTQPTLI